MGIWHVQQKVTVPYRDEYTSAESDGLPASELTVATTTWHDAFRLKLTEDPDRTADLVVTRDELRAIRDMLTRLIDEAEL